MAIRAAIASAQDNLGKACGHSRALDRAVIRNEPTDAQAAGRAAADYVEPSPDEAAR